MNFNEIKDTYGFVEVKHRSDGLFCAGCLQVHKYPTKMYTNNLKTQKELLCKYQVVNLYGDKK